MCSFDDDPGNEILPQVMFHALQRQSKDFSFLASVFPSHVVSLVNKVYCKSLLSLQLLYVYQKTISIFCLYSKRQMVIIETTFYLIFIPDNDPGDDDDDMPKESTFHGPHQQSKYFGFLASVFCSRVVYLVNKVYCKSLLFLQPLYVYQRLYYCSYSIRQMVITKTTFYLQLS